MLITFNDFVHKHNLKNKAIKNVKIYDLLKKRGLDSKVRIYLRDEIFSTKFGIVNRHLSKGTHWVCYSKDFYFDSKGCPRPKKNPIFSKSRYGTCVFFEYQIQKKDSFFGSNVLYIINSTKVLEKGFISAVLNL